MNDAEKLIAWAREHRPETPPAGDIRDPALLQELLTEVLDDHLFSVADARAQAAYVVQAPSGSFTVPATGPQPLAPEDVKDADPTAWALALLVGHLQDAQAAPVKRAAGR